MKRSKENNDQNQVLFQKEKFHSLKQTKAI